MVTLIGTIFRITSDGSVSEFVSGLGPCVGLAFDSEGNLYAADGGVSGVVHKITPAEVVSTYYTSAGSPLG